MLTCGVIGLPMVGKTTVFNLLTNAGAETSRFLGGKAEVNTASAIIPDRRVDRLAALYRPIKTTYADVQFSDIPGLVRGPGQPKGVNPFLEGVRGADVLVHVVRAFRADGVSHVDGSVDPARDIETMDLELVLSDIDLLERRIERIEKNRKQLRESGPELELLRRCASHLEGGAPLHTLELAAAGRAMLKASNLFSGKPLILVINIDEEQLRSGAYPNKETVARLAATRGIEALEVCGSLEGEIAGLAPEDREPFMADLGIDRLGAERLAEAAYRALGLISFFTVGEDEVRAWTIARGTDARHAAGKIHSDIERGFIRAEVMRYTDIAALPDVSGGKDKEFARLEGKEYVVADGDIISFRFNR